MTWQCYLVTRENKNKKQQLNSETSSPNIFLFVIKYFKGIVKVNVWDSPLVSTIKQSQK